MYDDESCLHAALIRAYRLPLQWKFPYQKSYGGCRSWVNLPEDGVRLLDGKTPSMSDSAWDEAAAKVRLILGES